MLTARQKKRNEDLLATLDQEVRDLCMKHLALCQGEGIDLLVVQATRTKKEQDSLYAQGRSIPGKIVTDARYGYSWHNFGRAYDVAIVFGGGRVIWEGPQYRKVGGLGISLGLVWGGNFSAIRGDLGHFEYHPGLTLAQARAAFEET